MSLIHLYDPLEKDEDFARFADANFTDHLLVIGAIQASGKQAPLMLDIRGLGISDAGFGGLWHQQLHDTTNALFGLASSDYVHIDYRDRSQVDSMRQLHAEEHRRWHDLLGI